MPVTHQMEYGELHAESAVWLSSDLDTPLVRLDGLRAAVFDKAGTRLAGVRNDNGVRIIDVEIGTTPALTTTESITYLPPRLPSSPGGFFTSHPPACDVVWGWMSRHPDP